MGFIPSSSTQSVNAYLTQSGRKKLLYSSASESQITFFTLHDNDINYLISSKVDDITLTYNILKNGFVPDITGDNDICIKSVAQAYEVNKNSYLIYGGDLVVLTANTGTTTTGPGGGTPGPGPGTGTPVGEEPPIGG